MTARILGVDPGLANCGWAIVELDGNADRLVDLGVIRTEKSAKKHALLASDDNVRRARILANELETAAHDIDSTGPMTDAICAESMSFPRSSSVAAKMAMAWGCIATLAVYWDAPIVQASPQQIKKAVAGSKTASKDDVKSALWQRYGRVLDEKLKPLPRSIHEHACDALAAVVTCLDSDVIRALRRR